MKKLVLYCFFLLIAVLIGQSNASGSTALRSDDVKPLTLLNPSLTLKANLYSGDEDEKASPVAETEFYLLDKSLIDILKDSNFKPQSADGKQHELKDNDYLTAMANAFSSDDEESALMTLLINREISKHQVFSLKTDYFGRAELKKLKMGNYYIFGIGETEDETFVWHSLVDIKSCANTIELDQYNAEAVFSADD